jgi:hypothetical protein
VNFAAAPPPGPATKDTVPPCFHAALSARYVLFCAGSSTSTGPVPAIAPAGGTIAAAAGFESNPMPGTLSNGAGSAAARELYGVGRALAGETGPRSLSAARTSSPRGFEA